MNKKEKFISKYLNLVYNSTYMPMHYLKHEQLLAIYPGWAFPIEELLIYQNTILQTDITFDYFVTDDYLYIGIVRNPKTDECVIAGPVALAPLSSDTMASIISKYAEDDASYTAMAEYFERTPTFSLNRFLSIMAMINVAMNKEVLDILEKYHQINTDVEKKVQKTHSNSLMERKENEAYHDTYYFEQEYYGYVEKGDVEGLKEFIKVIPSFTEGSVAADQVRQAKNIFITSITITTRRAIAGGLDIETAYHLSDNYIQEMEKMSDSTAITLLNNTAVFDFTQRVANAKIPQDMSQEIFRCIQYISNHVNQNLSVEQIAQVVNMDRSTLSKKFKRELGFNISSFIMRRKLEEAKTLLTYTDKTVSEISEYLCFSSQAYFQNVFKRQYGVTPRKYRLSH